LVVGIVGELDHHTAEYVRQKIDGEILKSTTKNLILDFSKVSFMDSSGIGVIMGRYKNMSNLNGKLIITSPGSQIKRVLEMSGMLKVIPMLDSVEEALKNM
jgi:stage II sporulation protein AA (anti-sigma F factor antagonist)